MNEVSEHKQNDEAHLSYVSGDGRSIVVIPATESLYMVNGRTAAGSGGVRAAGNAEAAYGAGDGKGCRDTSSTGDGAEGRNTGGSTTGGDAGSNASGTAGCNASGTAGSNADGTSGGTADGATAAGTPYERKLRVAAYCRVSTDEEKQLGSFDNQIEYFTNQINGNARYDLVAIYSDEGISGCSTRHRAGFKRMIRACENHEIDLIVTKSISRFARNTQDSLNYTRKLKDMGIGIYFEKEGINTLESSGELLLTLFSCFAQEESRSISENTSWGIRSKFRQGIPHINAKVLMGYDKGPDGNLTINESQAMTVRRIFREYMDGYSLSRIAGRLNADAVPGVYGKARWCSNTIARILENEKYKGALLMQKTYTANYLTKQCLKNTGQLNKYYVEHAHDAIIDPETWDAAQAETRRRRDFIREHDLRGLYGPGAWSPFYARLFCKADDMTVRRVYHSGISRAYWACPVCGAKVDEEYLRSCFAQAFNYVVTHRSDPVQIHLGDTASKPSHFMWSPCLAEAVRLERAIPCPVGHTTDGIKSASGTTEMAENNEPSGITTMADIWRYASENGEPLQKYRARQLLDITGGGTIPFEVPELTLAILQEAWIHRDEQNTSLSFTLLTGDTITVKY